MGTVLRKIMAGEKVEDVDISETWTYEDLLGLKFKLILPTDKFQGVDTNSDKINDRWVDMSADESFMKLLLASAEELEVVGIVKPKADAVSTVLQNSAVAYTKELTDWYINEISKSEIVKYQLENKDTDIFSGLPFMADVPETDEEKAQNFLSWFSKLEPQKQISVYTHIASTPDSATLQSLTATEIAKYSTRDLQENFIIMLYTRQSASGNTNGMTEENVRSMLASMKDSEIYDLVYQALTEMVKGQYSATQTARLKAMSETAIIAEYEAVINQADNVTLSRYYDVTSELRYSTTTLNENLTTIGYSDKDDPSSINIYAATFEDKDNIAELIANYNNGKPEESQITYTDYVAIMMSSISTIINMISYVLIAFVSISLVVSSIMIGIITYISVLERTKEIGILRSIGASKKDISRVFNAETLIVGYVAGLLGILVTVLLNIPISLIIEKFSDIKGLASLPLGGAIILVAISMTLTLIAGLIPSRVAAKKDPVEALRTE